MYSSPESSRSHTHSIVASDKQDDASRRDDVDDSSRSHRSRSSYSDCGDRSVHRDTTREEQDRDALRSAPENRAWMPSLSNLREWYGFTTGSCRIPLLDSSRLHGLDVSAKDYRIEHECYIDVFFRHRWYHGNHKRDELSLAQAWNSFISNVENVGSDAYPSKLNAARNKFKQKSMTGARYKLHRLSRESSLPCLSYGENCPCCVDN